jgi:hypothetical protein
MQRKIIDGHEEFIAFMDACDDIGRSTMKPWHADKWQLFMEASVKLYNQWHYSFDNTRDAINYWAFYTEKGE